MSKMKKAALAASLSLALAVGVSVNATSAWAGYLSAPTQVSSGTSGSFPATWETTTGQQFTYNYVGNSSYGNTIPSISSVPPPTGGITGTISSVTDSKLPLSDIYYNGSTLTLHQLNTMTDNYSFTNPTTGTITGQIVSNVFQIASGTKMAGAKTGELIFTYQFDVKSISNSSMNVSQETIALFNNPGSAGFYKLGAGINTTNGSPSGYSPLGTTICPSCTVATLSGLTGQVVFNKNGTTETLENTYGTPLVAGYVSPQFFIASNAYNYGLGGLTLAGSGVSGFDTVFVPNSPEPSTLVLLGSGLALLSFLAFRKKENQLVI
ncbi:MAG: PEP-CTERM sorting domain-containing protein [Leptospirales bacterium]